MNPPQPLPYFAWTEDGSSSVQWLDPVFAAIARAERLRLNTLSPRRVIVVPGSGREDVKCKDGERDSTPANEFVWKVWSRGWAKELHVVLDNLSAHKTKDVDPSLAEHPTWKFPFHTDVFDHGSIRSSSGSLRSNAMSFATWRFTSVADLGKNFRYIRLYSKSAKPFLIYGSSRRIRPNKIAGTAY